MIYTHKLKLPPVSNIFPWSPKVFEQKLKVIFMTFVFRNVCEFIDIYTNEKVIFMKYTIINQGNKTRFDGQNVFPIDII